MVVAGGEEEGGEVVGCWARMEAGVPACGCIVMGRQRHEGARD